MSDENNGGGSQGDNKAEALQKALAKHQGDAMALATFLFSDNYDQREKRRQAEAKLPKDGAVIVSKEDAALLEAAKATGLKPDEFKGALESSADDKKEIARLKRKDILRDVAQAHGYKLSVLEDLDGKAEGVEYVRKEEKDKGGQVKVAYHVKSEGKEVPLEQFATEKWADYMPALRQEQGVGNAARSGHTRDPNPAAAASALDRVRDQEKKRQEKVAPPAGSLIDRFRGRTPART